MKKLKSCSEIDKKIKDMGLIFCRQLGGRFVMHAAVDIRHTAMTQVCAAEIGASDLEILVEGCDWAWEEVEKKKEIVGVDFVYGLDVAEAPSSALCAGCCFWEKSDRNWVCVKKGRVCETGDNGVYVLVKIPKKRPHVKGMAAIGAWVEERGLAVSSAGPLVFWSDEHGHYNMKNIFAYAGEEIFDDDFIPEEFADLIEYK